jgi:hypothetical protein
MRDPQGCGLIVDCPATYTLAQVNASAAQWDAFNASAAALLASRHERARDACGRRSERLAEGAWCLNTPATAPRGSEVRTVSLPGGHSYELVSPHVEADAIIVVMLQELLRPHADGRRASVLDLGAVSRR